MAAVTVAVAAPAEVRDVLRLASSPKTDPHGRHCVDALMALGQCWKFVEHGAITGAMVTTDDDGELWVLAAAGRSPVDLVAVMADHLIAQADGKYRSIGFQTARRGLVKKAEHHGYEVSAYIMRKTL